MTHAERRALILKPFPPLSRRIPGKSWAGVLIRSTPLPEEGHRVGSSIGPEDEEILKLLYPGRLKGFTFEALVKGV